MLVTCTLICDVGEESTRLHMFFHYLPFFSCRQIDIRISVCRANALKVVEKYTWIFDEIVNRGRKRNYKTKKKGNPEMARIQVLFYLFPTCNL